MLQLHRDITTVLTALLLVACTTTASIAPAWLTLRLIERGTVTAEQVITTTERIQALLVLDGTTLTEAGTEIRRQLGYDNMPASDRLLVDAALADIAEYIGTSVTSPLNPEHVARANALLTQIQTYARAAE